MNERDPENVILKKAKMGRNEHQARSMSPAKALRQALEKASDKLLGLSLTVATVEQLKVPIDEIGNKLPEDGLLLLLDGPDGARGAIALDLELLTSLIEIQTTGQVFDTPVQPRQLTPTDAAMTAEIVDAVLARFEAYLTDAPESAWSSGFRYGVMLADARTLGLALEAPEYHLFRLAAEVADGARAGKLIIILPVRAADVPERTGEPAVDRASLDLEENVLDAPVVLDAVIAQLDMPLAQMLAFNPGDTLKIPKESIFELSVLSAGMNCVMKARLGQLNGFRAIQLGRGNDPEALQSAIVAGFAAEKSAAQPVHSEDGLPDEASEMPPQSGSGGVDEGSGDQSADTSGVHETATA